MLIVLNNKSSFNLDQFMGYLEKVKKYKGENNIILCPSDCYLPLCSGVSFSIGSQDVSCGSSLSMTGEITASQLKSLGVKYSIVGHSDRANTNLEISKKIQNLLDNNIIPILCIGEKNSDMDIISIKNELLTNVEDILSPFSSFQLDNIIIAYEPIWAIGNDQNLNYSNIEEILAFIKDKFPNNKVLYGGGVNKQNYMELSRINNLDGFLLGRFGNSIFDID